MSNSSNEVAGSDLLPEAVDIAIIGAGIGGASAAVALRHAGFDAHAFERAAVLEEIGGAVVIREPSMNLFDDWGAGRAIREHAVAVSVLEMRNPKTSAVVGEYPLDSDGTGAAWSTHRADVHSALLKLLPAEILHLGVTTEQVQDDENGAIARFEDGRSVHARLVVGADGIRSVTRRLLSEDEMIFTHLVNIRSLISADALPAGFSNDVIRIWGGEPLALTAIPLHSGEQIALGTIIQAETPPEHLWTNDVPLSELARLFTDFDPLVPALVAASSAMVKASPVYEREPLTKWSTQSVTLLGDAAHPMAPRMGQGANSAIQDAGALADALTKHGLDDLQAALNDYEQTRIPVATAMQLGSRQAPQARPPQ